MKIDLCEIIEEVFCYFVFVWSVKCLVVLNWEINFGKDINENCLKDDIN